MMGFPGVIVRVFCVVSLFSIDVGRDWKIFVHVRFKDQNWIQKFVFCVFECYPRQELSRSWSLAPTAKQPVQFRGFELPAS